MATGSDEFRAQSLRVTSLQGQFQVDDESSVAGMDRLEIVVCSQPRTGRRAQPRDYSWARATVGAEGHFSISAISEGTLLLPGALSGRVLLSPCA